MDGKEILEFRKLHKLTQKIVANDLGVSQSKISAYEQGERPVPMYFEKHFTLYKRLSTFTSKRVYDNIDDEFSRTIGIITKAGTRAEIEQSIGAMLIRGMEGKRWRGFIGLTKLIERYRKLLRFAIKRVKEIEGGRTR